MGPSIFLYLLIVSSGLRPVTRLTPIWQRVPHPSPLRRRVKSWQNSVELRKYLKQISVSPGGQDQALHI